MQSATRDEARHRNEREEGRAQAAANRPRFEQDVTEVGEAEATACLRQRWMRFHEVTLRAARATREAKRCPL